MSWFDKVKPSTFHKDSPPSLGFRPKRLRDSVVRLPERRKRTPVASHWKSGDGPRWWMFPTKRREVLYLSWFLMVFSRLVKYLQFAEMLIINYSSKVLITLTRPGTAKAHGWSSCKGWKFHSMLGVHILGPKDMVFNEWVTQLLQEKTSDFGKNP